MKQGPDGIENHYLRQEGTGLVDDFQAQDSAMKAVCLTNDPKDLADYKPDQAHRALWRLTPGRPYPIAGMASGGGGLSFLVRDDSGGPLFAPAELFEMFEADFPTGWIFAVNSGLAIHAPEGPPTPPTQRRNPEDELSAVWGYRELVEDPMHATALLDWAGPRVAEAMAAFDRAIAESSGLEAPLRALLEQVALGVSWDEARAVEEDLEHIRFGDALVRLAWMVADHLVLIAPTDFEFIMSAASELRCEKDLPMDLGELVADG
jgi:hypothetical protein